MTGPYVQPIILTYTEITASTTDSERSQTADGRTWRPKRMDEERRIEAWKRGWTMREESK